MYRWPREWSRRVKRDLSVLHRAGHLRLRHAHYRRCGECSRRCMINLEERGVLVTRRALVNCGAPAVESEPSYEARLVGVRPAMLRPSIDIQAIESVRHLVDIAVFGIMVVVFLLPRTKDQICERHGRAGDGGRKRWWTSSLAVATRARPRLRARDVISASAEASNMRIGSLGRVTAYLLLLPIRRWRILNSRQSEQQE